MIHVPSFLALALLGLGMFRLVRLVAYDEITVDLRRIVTRTSDSEYKQWAHFIEGVKANGGNPWAEGTLEPAVRELLPSERRYYFSKLIRCPWCIGWWLSGLAWLAWSLEPRVTLWLLAWPAISAIVGLVAKKLDP